MPISIRARSGGANISLTVLAVISALGVIGLLAAVTNPVNAYAQSDQDATPSKAVRRYIHDPAAARPGPLPGFLLLSSSSAQFENLHGKMKLKYAGKMPELRGSEAGGALVFQVLNADIFASENQELRRCGAPVRWITIIVTGADIRLGWLTNSDWRTYVPSETGLCLAVTFELAGAWGE